MKYSLMRIFLSGVFVLAFTDCYTRFATLDTNKGDDHPARAQTYIDSAGDTVSAAPRVDTVRERETCYWQRDFFGRLRLRCYRNYYDNDWYDYYNRPWWYGTYSRYYDSDCNCYCPYEYSYYDGYCTDCAYCRDYCYWHCRSSYNYFGGGYPATGDGTAAPATSTPPRRSIRSGIPSSTPPAASSSTNSTAPQSAVPPSSTARDSALRQSGTAESPRIHGSVRQSLMPHDEKPVRTLQPKQGDVLPVRPPENSSGVESAAPEITIKDSAKSTYQTKKRRRSVRQW